IRRRRRFAPAAWPSRCRRVGDLPVHHLVYHAGDLSLPRRVPGKGVGPHLFFPLRARRCRRANRRRERNTMRSVKRLVFLNAGLLLLIGGCTVGPNYQKPDIAVPSKWQEAQQTGIDTRSAELTRWWTAFNDPLLNSLVERAVRSNLDLRLAEARIREARASRAVTAAGEWPAVDVSSSYKRIRSSENAFAVSPQGGGGPSSFPGSNLDQNFYQAGFDASWEIDVFGGVRRSVEAA